MNQSKRELTGYFENLSLFVIGIFLFLLPLLFLSTTTDAFVLPKEVLLGGTISLFVIFFGLKNIFDAKLKLRASPFDMPVVTIIVVAFLSAIFSVNRFDAFAAFVPLLLIAFLYFSITNVLRMERQLLFILACLMLGAVVSGIITLASFFKIYLLPFPYTHVQYFTTFGSLLDQAIYFALLLPIAAYFIYPLFRSLFSAKKLQSPFAGASGEPQQSKKMNGVGVAFGISFLIILISLTVTIYMLFTSQKPLILPLDTGLQTGFAAISQDTGNVLKSFLLGSGIGTYVIDFTRFKTAAYNANASIWAFTFFRSSSYLLEVLATMGILGLASYIFLAFRMFREKNFFLPLILAFIAAILLPFSFTLLVLFFVLLGIFGVIRIHNKPEKYGDMEFYFVALKRGLLVAKTEGETVTQNNVQRQYSKFLPILFFLFTLVVVGIPMYFTAIYFISDMTFQQSLVAASQNNGLQTYNLEIAAIKLFPYRDIYYRTFAQTNIALANSLAINLQRNPKDPNAPQNQQNILTLIQQGISAGRSATTIAPYTAFNWNNLSSIYRSLIGFGQNADKFTVLTLQQAIALDPNNPQQYVDLGGVYYQLGQYDDAIRQFQFAINLKQDYANAYYNLGHALQSKGDNQNALAAYETVKTLVTADPTNSAKIASEINALNNSMNQQGNSGSNPASQSASASVTPAPQEQAQPIEVNRSANQLPERKPPVKIPGPSISPVATTPTPAQ